jgi:hypothetical protein
VDAIRYTFTLDGGPKFKLQRTWIWEPKKDQITFEGKDKAGKGVKVTYVRSQLASQDAFVKETVDQASSMISTGSCSRSTSSGTPARRSRMPACRSCRWGRKARKVVLKYPSAGGYLPGDTWELFVGNDMRIREMKFHHGGNEKPSVVVANWIDYKTAGPLLFSLDHHGKADGHAFRLNFTNVAVKLAGSDTWVEPK